MPTSEAVTRGIRVQVESSYVPERSQPANGAWLFAYRLRLTNEGSEKVQLQGAQILRSETYVRTSQRRRMQRNAADGPFPSPRHRFHVAGRRRTRME